MRHPRATWFRRSLIALIALGTLALAHRPSSAKDEFDRLLVITAANQKEVVLAGKPNGGDKLLVLGTKDSGGPTFCLFFANEWKWFSGVVQAAKTQMSTISLDTPRSVMLGSHRSTAPGLQGQTLTARVSVMRDPKYGGTSAFLQLDIGTELESDTVFFAPYDVAKLETLVARGAAYMSETSGLGGDVKSDKGASARGPSTPLRITISSRYDSTFKNGWFAHFHGPVKPGTRYRVRVNGAEPFYQIQVFALRGGTCILRPLSDGLELHKDDTLELFELPMVVERSDVDGYGDSRRSNTLNRAFVTVDSVTPVAAGSRWSIQVRVSNHGDVAASAVAVLCSCSTYSYVQTVGELAPQQSQFLVFESSLPVGGVPYGSSGRPSIPAFLSVRTTCYDGKIRDVDMPLNVKVTYR